MSALHPAVDHGGRAQGGGQGEQKDYQHHKPGYLVFGFFDLTEGRRRGRVESLQVLYLPATTWLDPRSS